LKKIQEKAKYVKKNKKLGAKIKNYTAFMTETIAGSRSKSERENETSGDEDEDDENSEDLEAKANRAARKSAEFFDSDNEISSDDDSSSLSSTTSDSKKKMKTKECDSNKQETNIPTTKMLLKKYNKLMKDAFDFKLRYCGHCNVATDIKEANFLGE
jgi:WD and tetratricopeptide repeat-containing protein 1